MENEVIPHDIDNIAFPSCRSRLLYGFRVEATEEERQAAEKTNELVSKLTLDQLKEAIEDWMN